MKGWHFIRADRKLQYEDVRTVVDGEKLTVDVEPVLCEAGLHASRNALDALAYAPGPIACRVELSGKIVHGDDKSVATERTCLWSIDATEVLRAFARKCALAVIHLWDAPDIVVRYLKTGDAKLRAAAWDAADIAAANAASTGAGDAVQAAAQAATYAAARVVMPATRVVTQAARVAAGAAARTAARAAARAAAADAAWAAGRAARDAMRKGQNRRLTAMLIAEYKRQQGKENS